MSDRVFIRLPSDRHGDLVRLQGAALEVVPDGTANATGSSDPAIVFVPTAQVLLCEAQVPTRNRARMRQAVPYALEEQLAQDIDDLHFALGPAAQGQVSTAALGHAVLEDWLARLETTGIAAEALVPDALALPWQDGQWTLLLEADSVLARTAAARGWAVEREHLAWMLEAELRQHGAPTRVLVLQSESAADLPLALAPDIEVVRERVPGHALTVLAQHFDPATAINLLQGRYQRGPAHGEQRKRWRWVAALAALLLAAELGGAWFENARLQRDIQQAQQRIESEFRAAFPHVQRVVDAKAQMQQELQRLRASGQSDGAFLALLTDAAPALAGSEPLRITRLQYRDRHLELDLDAPSFQALDRIKQTLLERGLRAEILSASAAGQGVSGRLRIAGDAS